MKQRKKENKNTGKDTLFIDETTCIHRKKGNGLLKRQVWVNDRGEVTRYSLAYVNYNLFCKDNGRVLGYDNAHGYHHQHLLGKIKSIVFSSFDEIEDLFQKEYEALHEQLKKK